MSACQSHARAQTAKSSFPKFYTVVQLPNRKAELEDEKNWKSRLEMGVGKFPVRWKFKNLNIDRIGLKWFKNCCRSIIN